MTQQMPIEFTEERRAVNLQKKVVITFQLFNDMLTTSQVVDELKGKIEVLGGDSITAHVENTNRVDLSVHGEVVWLNRRFDFGLPESVVTVWGPPISKKTFDQVEKVLCQHGASSPIVAVVRQEDGYFRFKQVMLETDYKGRKSEEENR